MIITLDTRLADIGYDNAGGIGEDLIDTRIAGQDWGMAWSRTLRSNEDATVADLRQMMVLDRELDTLSYQLHRGAVEELLPKELQRDASPIDPTVWEQAVEGGYTVHDLVLDEADARRCLLADLER